MAKKIKEKLDILFKEEIICSNLEKVVSERFGAYSKYIIQDRALPNVKDGLKPVQRRILYGMYKMGMFSNKPYKKSARIVGEVMGKYHPHGDSSIYEAMVRMSQDFKTNMLLVDIHGNNGSIDGDSAAAMRYTEARLTKASEELLRDIGKNTVDYIPNFDDEEYEPVVLPSKIPNILVNGSTGISSGYATNIPPHNPLEIINAVIKRIKKPSSSLSEIMEYVRGPDFPTGGIVEGKKGITDAFETGSGKIVIKAKVAIENNAIIVTELPYEVNKANLVRKIDEIRIQKKVPGISEVRDESDRDGLRIAIDLKDDCDSNVVLSYLYKFTELKRNYSYNMTAINNRCPKQMGLIEILDAYIGHQKEIMTRRCEFDLEKAAKRLHIVDGLKKMVSILDEVIKAIRESHNKAESKENIKNKFNFSLEQAEAIVTLQLYRLSNTDIVELEEEFYGLLKEIDSLSEILNDTKILNNIIVKELNDIKKNFKDIRKTKIEDEIKEIKINQEDLIIKEECLITFTKDNYIKRTKYSKQSNYLKENYGIKENDLITHNFHSNTLNKVIAFTSKGNYLFIPIHTLVDSKWKNIGTHISNIVTIDTDEKIVNLFVIENFKNELYFLITTREGLVKRTKINEFEVVRYSKKIKATKIKNTDSVVSVDIGNDTENILVVSTLGKAMIYPVSEINEFGTNASGVICARITAKNKEHENILGCKYLKKTSDALILTTSGNIIRINSDYIEHSKRTRTLNSIINKSKSESKFFVDFIVVDKADLKNNAEIMIISDEDKVSIEGASIKYTKSKNGNKLVNLKGLKKLFKIQTNLDFGNTKKTKQYKDNQAPKIDLFDDEEQIKFDI